MTQTTPTNEKDPTAALRGKLNAARKLFHATNPTKSGHNEYANYSYFELSDFLPEALKAFDEVGLNGKISFKPEEATMTLTDLETGATDEITVPMSEASLKGCHPVQNLGAVITYLRRYLWAIAIELVEPDKIDSSEQVAETTRTTQHRETHRSSSEVKAPLFNQSIGSTFTAHIAGIDESSGEKNGKKWTRHVVSFDNERKATTFDEKVLGKSRVGDHVSATIKPAKTAGYWDLVALSMLPEEEEE